MSRTRARPRLLLAMLLGAALGMVLALVPGSAAAEPARPRSALQAYRTAATHPLGQLLGVGLALGLAGALVVARGRRRAGELSVALEYPGEWYGTFVVRLLPPRGEVRPTPRATREARARRSTRTMHRGVSRETHFRGVPPGRYRVTVEGVLRARQGNAVQREPFDLQEVEVREDQSTRVEFDLRPRLCPVQVTVLWNRQPAKDVQVALFAQPNTLRYARRGITSLVVPLGKHRVLVGSGDRVAERELDATDLTPRALEVDLGEGDVLFKGCPHAVTPYLAGDLSAAARALQREGQARLAQRLEAYLQETMGNARRAAVLYRESGDWANAVRLLEPIPGTDPHYVVACEMLADYFESEGLLEQAIQRIEAAIGIATQRPQLRDLHERLAGLYERADQLPRALELLEQLREEQPEREGLRTRIETLRKRISVARATTLRFEREGPGQSRYEILDQLGAGGMGVVFRALDRRLGREVALKRLAENLRDNPVALQLVEREARAAAALNHPNIVTLFDADQEEGRFFITMELLRGHPLSTLLRRNGPFGAGEVAKLGRQAAAGLEYAHARGVIHRDIKPGNLFLCETQVLKIMDFGLAKLVEEVRKQGTVLAGTPCYMAPEQSTGAQVGPPCDLYSLGVSLFELAAGQVPFREGDVAKQHRYSPPPDPRELAPDLPDALAELVLELLAKRPDARPDAGAARARLEAIAAQLAIGV
jgi:tetratricopeptide (TPR) repeat protein